MKFFRTDFFEDPWLIENKENSFVLSSVVDSLTEETAKQVYSYMMSCPVVAAWLSPSPDPLNHQAMVSIMERGDGKYVWSDMHAHLVKNYHMKLPENFLSHVQNRINAGFVFTSKDEHTFRKNYNATWQRYKTMENGKFSDVSVYSLIERTDLIVDFDKIFELQ